MPNIKNPKKLLEEVEKSVSVLEGLFETLKRSLLTKNELQEVKKKLEKESNKVDRLFRDMSTNVWSRVSEVLFFQSTIDKIYESSAIFQARRLQWIARAAIKDDYLDEPLTVQSSIVMLEALLPNINPVIALYQMEAANQAAIVSVNLQINQQAVSITQDVMTKSMNFKNFDETVRAIEEAVERMKKK